MPSEALREALHFLKYSYAVYLLQPKSGSTAASSWDGWMCLEQRAAQACLICWPGCDASGCRGFVASTSHADIPCRPWPARLPPAVEAPSSGVDVIFCCGCMASPIDPQKVGYTVQGLAVRASLGASLLV